jgi:ribonucleoside-diphosphate reductase alpha chain
LPNDASLEKVGNIYLDAWKQGLKGITVYRDGSRTGVLISNEESQKQKNPPLITETVAPHRPKIIDAAVIRFQNAEEKWIAYVGLIGNKPYEIFTGKAQDAFSIPDWVEKGWIIKNKNESGKSRYDFQYMDLEGYRVTIEGLSRSFDKEYWNYAKLISGVLRHGMPLPQVVNLIEELHLLDENINTWKAGVERALKKFIPDGTPAADHTCSDCGDPEGLIYEEGCLKCKNCGSTRCG